MNKAQKIEIAEKLTKIRLDLVKDKSVSSTGKEKTCQDLLKIEQELYPEFDYDAFFDENN